MKGTNEMMKLLSSFFIRVDEVGNCCGNEATSQDDQKDEPLQINLKTLAWNINIFYSLFSNVSEQRIFLREVAWNIPPPNLDLLSSF